MLVAGVCVCFWPKDSSLCVGARVMKCLVASHVHVSLCVNAHSHAYACVGLMWVCIIRYACRSPSARRYVCIVYARNLHSDTYLHMSIHVTYICMYICMYTHIHIYVYADVCMYVHHYNRAM